MDTTRRRRHRTGRIVALVAALAPLVVGTLPLPGAGAVGRALEASDRARARALAHDTIR